MQTNVITPKNVYENTLGTNENVSNVKTLNSFEEALSLLKRLRDNGYNIYLFDRRRAKYARQDEYELMKKEILGIENHENVNTRIIVEDCVDCYELAYDVIYDEKRVFRVFIFYVTRDELKYEKINP